LLVVSKIGESSAFMKAGVCILWLPYPFLQGEFLSYCCYDN